MHKSLVVHDKDEYEYDVMVQKQDMIHKYYQMIRGFNDSYQV